MRVLDLFSGTGSASEPFLKTGHDVLRVDNDPRFSDVPNTLMMDVRDPQLYGEACRFLGGEPDVVWASPPCTAFSMAGAGSKKNGSERWEYRDKDDPHPFYGPRVPIDEVSRMGCVLVLATLRLVLLRFKPSYWWMENPRGGLRTMGFMQDVPGPITITYCQYGENRMKPTDLWGEWPSTWIPRKACKNGDPCHE